MFSSMLTLNKIGSWLTTPIKFRNQRTFSWSIGRPSIRIYDLICKTGDSSWKLPKNNLSRIVLIKSEQQIDYSRLSASTGSNNGHDLTRLNIEGNSFQNGHGWARRIWEFHIVKLYGALGFWESFSQAGIGIDLRFLSRLDFFHRLKKDDGKRVPPF